MNLWARPWQHRPGGCVPWPAVLLRVSVLVLVLVFVAVLLRLGYDPQTCLVRASGSVAVAGRAGTRMSRPA